MRNTIYNVSYLINALISAIKAIDFTTPEPSPSRYQNYSEEDLVILLYTAEKIRAASGDRPLHIFTIPAAVDVLAGEDAAFQRVLPAALGEFANENTNIWYTDLLPAFLRHSKQNDLDYLAYTLGCDGHWNHLGHRVVADVVMESQQRNSEEPRSP